MRFAILLSAALVLAACGGGSEGMTDPPADTSCTEMTARLLARQVGPALSIADARPNAAAGSASFQISGDLPRTVSGRAGALEYASGPGSSFTFVDAFAVNEQGVPTSELFVVATAAATERQLPLTPVSLAQLHDKAFFPTGSFVVYAEQYDPAVKDYTRWLIAQSGTVNITHVDSGTIGRIQLTVSLAGEWVDHSGTTLGCGAIADAHVDAPLVRFLAPTAQLHDTLTAALASGRTDTLGTSTLASFQLLNPTQSRLLITGSVTGDSTKELWLSIPGVAAAGDSIALGTPTITEAIAGRASTPFGMLRVIPTADSSSEQLWRSTGGYVTLTNIVQIGPLALCGWASGRYHIDATGVDLADTTTSLGTMTASGVFESRFTVVAPADTLVGAAAMSLASRFVHPAALAPASGPSCPF